jgi:uncharacterized membrane protein YeaQ/YmgE (transglycosylase-associated protein family)
MEQILINLVAGAVGGIAAGAAVKQYDMGVVGNTIAGLVGGGILGQILTLIWPSLSAAMAGGSFDIGAVLSHLIAGGVGGAILQVVAGAVKNSMARSA